MILLILRRDKMIVLGIDPGYAIVGWGVVKYEKNRFTPVAFGAITTDATVDFIRRIEIIYDELTVICQKFRPDGMSVEKLFFNSNQKTAINVAEARGVIMLAAKKNAVPIFEYTPLQVKQSVAGYGKAEKKQVMEMTRVLLCLAQTPKPDDTADALAVAICHAHTAGSMLYTKTQFGR